MASNLDYGAVEYVQKHMPMMGFGTYLMCDEAELDRALECALQCGYRFFDTAQVYRNEKFVGKSLKRCMESMGLRRYSQGPWLNLEFREELFITSKLHPKDNGGGAYECVKRSLKALQLDFLDLYLIHWPGRSRLKVSDPRNVEARRQAWAGLEKAYNQGLVKAIGVSNFEPAHLDDLLQHCTVVPALNQCEFHPDFCPQSVLDACKKHGVLFQAYSSLGTSDGAVAFQDRPSFRRLAEQLNCSVPQLLLAWALSQDISVLPKSCDPAHIRENWAALQLRLSPEQVEQLRSAEPKKLCWDPKSVA